MLRCRSMGRSVRIDVDGEKPSKVRKSLPIHVRWIASGSDWTDSGIIEVSSLAPGWSVDVPLPGEVVNCGIEEIRPFTPFPISKLSSHKHAGRWTITIAMNQTPFPVFQDEIIVSVSGEGAKVELARLTGAGTEAIVSDLRFNWDSIEVKKSRGKGCRTEIVSVDAEDESGAIYSTCPGSWRPFARGVSVDPSGSLVFSDVAEPWSGAYCSLVPMLT